MFFPGVGHRSDDLGSTNRIWAIGGGKGGTGKSLVTANMGMCLARQGFKVCLVDADLGTANLHTFVGLDAPQKTLSDFLDRRVDQLQALVTWTDIPNLSLISGARDVLEAANVKFAQKVKLLRHLRFLDFDFVLIDLGAGTSFNVMDFFLVADVGILCSSPEPTAVENTYRFLKSFYYRVLSRTIANHRLKNLVHQAVHGHSGRIVQNPLELIEAVESQSEEAGHLIRRELDSFNLKLVINKARTDMDMKMGGYIRSACLKYFGLELDLAGIVVYDDQVWRSLRLRRPFYVSHPLNPAARNIASVCARLIGHNRRPGQRNQQPGRLPPVREPLERLSA